MSSASAVPGFRLLWEGLLQCFLFFFRAKDLDAKAASVIRSAPCIDLHAFAKKRQRQMLGRRSRIPVSCAGGLVFIRSLFARVDEVTSAKQQLRFDLTSSFWTGNRVWPYLTAWRAWVYGHSICVQVRSARVGQARATRVLVLDYVG